MTYPHLVNIFMLMEDSIFISVGHMDMDFISDMAGHSNFFCWEKCFTYHR